MMYICKQGHIFSSKSTEPICPTCGRRLERAIWDDSQKRYIMIRPSKRKARKKEE